jgi:hypothetical protein
MFGLQRLRMQTRNAPLPAVRCNPGERLLLEIVDVFQGSLGLSLGVVMIGYKVSAAQRLKTASKQCPC